MAAAVVDILEIVEVDNDQSQARTGSRRNVQIAVDDIVEPTPVGQAGQAIMQRQVPDRSSERRCWVISSKVLTHPPSGSARERTLTTTPGYSEIAGASPEALRAWLRLRSISLRAARPR
jgi:hypothetical protein